MPLSDTHIQALGQQLLAAADAQKTGGESIGQKLLYRMMDSEPFRVAALRFVDVAPTLRNDEALMAHLTAYFAEAGGLAGFLGAHLPANKLTARVVAPMARANIRAMAHTFIAGETLDSALPVLRGLHDDGIACSVDLLGEAVLTKAEADGFVAAYHDAIDRLADATAAWPAATYPEADRIGPIARANVSLKLSALYEHVKPVAHSATKATLAERFRALLDTAMACGVYLHVDMEQYELVPLTLDVFETVLLEAPYKTYPHVGIVCQAYLKDSGAILDRLIKLARKRGTPISIRLVKGAYWDYEAAHAAQTGWPLPVFPTKAATDANFEHLTEKLIKAFPAVRPCIGSHNARSLAVAMAAVEEAGLEPRDIELQMIYGMAAPFRNAAVGMGYRVRQYCPVGEFIPGLSYLVRRLLENTANQNFLRLHSRTEADSATLLAPPRPGPDVPAGTATTPRFTNHPLLDFSQEANRTRAAAALKNFPKALPVTVRPRIAGKRTPGGKTLTHTCPWDTAQSVTTVHLATKKDATAAVASARAGWPVWRELGADKRADIIAKAADLAVKYWDELFALQIYEAGKDWQHADADIAEGIDFMRYYAAHMRTLAAGLQPLSVHGEANHTIYEPRGVTAVIAPWNFPFAISAGMTSAALVAGNPVVYKPAEQTSAIGAKLAEIYVEAGVPADVFHFLPGRGEEVGEALVTHPDVAAIAFTGSQAVGVHIQQQAGKLAKGQTVLKKCVIEMGGKNALIVDDDADLDEAVPAAVASAFGFQGQKCSACSRVYVVGSAWGPFTERLRELVSGLRVGPPTDPASDVCAVIDAEAAAKIRSYLKVGNKDGKLLAAAPLPDDLPTGHYIPPTVFTNVKKSSRLTKEEVFGPVLAVYKAATLEDAVAQAMDSPYRLTGGVFSRNPASLAYVEQHLRVGNLYLNRGITGALVGRQPFGGGHLSGTCAKTGGPDYLLNFLEPRTITENTMRRGYAPQTVATDGQGAAIKNGKGGA